MAACTQIMITPTPLSERSAGILRNTRKTALFPAHLMKRDLDRLNANRGPDEGYSDVILRLAKLEKRGKLA